MDTEKIILIGGAEVTIPKQFEYTKCKSCGQEIIWATTKNGKFMPIYWNTIKQAWVSHFSDCTDADLFRKKYGQK